MDPSRRPYPHVLDPDKVEWSVAEIDAALELVAAGIATRVRLCELPEIAAAIAFGLAHAQAAGIELRYEPGEEGHAQVIVGPRLADRAGST